MIDREKKGFRLLIMTMDEYQYHPEDLAEGEPDLTALHLSDDLIKKLHEAHIFYIKAPQKETLIGTALVDTNEQELFHRVHDLSNDHVAEIKAALRKKKLRLAAKSKQGS